MSKNPKVHKVVKIIDEWTDFYTNKHYLLLEIEGIIILNTIELNWGNKDV